MPKAKSDATEPSNVIPFGAPSSRPPGWNRSDLPGVSELVELLLPEQVMPVGRLAAQQATWDVKESNPDVYYSRLKAAFCCFARELAAAGQL